MASIPRFSSIFRAVDGAADVTDAIRGARTAGEVGKHLPGFVKGPVAASSDAGFVLNTGQGHGIHAPISVADGVASGASLLKEGAEIGGKYLPKIAGATEAIAANPLIKGAVKASPYLWAANMGLQGVDVARNPERNKQEMQQVADYNGTRLAGIPVAPELQRAWYGLNNPVKAIAGATQLSGDVVNQTMQNYEDARKNARLDGFRNDDPAKAGPVAIGRALDSAYTPLEGGYWGSRALDAANNNIHTRAAIDYLSRVSPDKIREELTHGGARNTPMALLHQSGQTPDQIINQIKRVADRSTPTANPSQLSTVPISARDYSQARSSYMAPNIDGNTAKKPLPFTDLR